jgi:type VI secretion system protein ImpF
MESRNQRDELEREPRRFRGLKAPLFERLIGNGETDSEHAEPYRTQGPVEAVESIRRELVRLLNTRTPPNGPASADNTVVNYGIPDFSHLSAADPGACDALAALIARKIAAFEPRLNRVRVALTAHPTDKRRVIGAVEAYVELGLMPEAVCFPLELHSGAGTAILEAPASSPA